MAKVQGKLGNDFCPQQLWLYGSYEEDGRPHFGLFTWFGWCWLGEGDGSLGVMACIGEDKRTKDLIRKTGVFSANLVSEALLPLADYYGNVSGREHPEKMERQPTVEPGGVLPVPTIAESPVSVELKLVREERLAGGRLADGGESESTLLLCRVENVTVEEALGDETVPFIQRLRLAAPVLSPGEERYVSISGEDLGAWGEPMGKLTKEG